MPVEVSDEVFEANLPKVQELWEQKDFDTVDMSIVLKIPENVVEHILHCDRDAIYDYLQDQAELNVEPNPPGDASRPPAAEHDEDAGITPEVASGAGSAIPCEGKA